MPTLPAVALGATARRNFSAGATRARLHPLVLALQLALTCAYADAADI